MRQDTIPLDRFSKLRTTTAVRTQQGGPGPEKGGIGKDRCRRELSENVPFGFRIILVADQPSFENMSRVCYLVSLTVLVPYVARYSVLHS